MTDPDAPIRTTHVGSLVRPGSWWRTCARSTPARTTTSRPTRSAWRARSATSSRRSATPASTSSATASSASRPGTTTSTSASAASSCARARRATRTSPASTTRPTDWARFPEFYAEYFAHEQEYESPGGDWACVAPVTYTGGEVIARDIANLKAAMDAAGAQEGFLPVVAPASCFPNLIDEHYGSEEAALLGIADALAEEYRAIVDAGLNLQIDDAYIPFMYDVLVPPGTMDDYRAWAQPRIAALNHALEGIPQDKVRYHVCWGSWNGPHTNDIALRDVLELMFAGQRRHLPLRARQPAPRARVARLGGRRPARRQDRSPRASSATRRTSSSTPSSWPSASSAPRGWSAPSTSWPARTAASPRARTSSACTRRSSGRSSARSRRGPSSPRAR